MSDLIRREDVIAVIKRCKDRLQGKGLTYDIMLDMVERIPSADRPQEWIPCSERMPSEQGQYLVTISLYDNSTYVDVLHFHKGKFYEIDSEWGNVEYDDVTAWMPLPKPWKGADDE